MTPGKGPGYNTAVSQRLLVCSRAQVVGELAVLVEGYDAVLTEDLDHEAARGRLWRDWFMDTGAGYVGPWKLRIEDAAVFRQHEAAIRAVFAGHGRHFPDDLWFIYGPGGGEGVEPSEAGLADVLARAAPGKVVAR